ncbi:MAG: hypothetical protein DRJ03_14895 [Chloroflexi bacterium]|nr:MAG: hypothetical protein DRJ03_14895 [Chloroflexota bacterium]
MADKAIGVHLEDWHIAQGVRTGNSPWSPIAIAQVPVKEPTPSAPTIESVTAPEASAGVLEIKVSLPETNADGTALARAELVRLRLHHSTRPGVDESDPYVDFPPSETLLWAPNDTVTHYVRVRVQDSHGLWSELSNEASGQAHASTPQEDSGLWAHRLGVESIFTDDSPELGYVSWSNVVLYWRDNKYEIEDGNTNKKYIWWDYSASTTTFQTSDTRPELDLEDVIIGYNDNGTWRLMCYQPMVMADYVRAGVLQSSNWGATTGSQLDLDNGTLKLGGSDSPKFQVDADGVLHATGAVISGNVTIMGGTGVANLSDAGALATLDVVGTAHIDDLAVTTAKIADAAITTAKIDDLAVTEAKIADAAITNAKIADAAITNAKIADATITDAKIANLTFSKITAGTNTASLTIGSGGYIQSANYSPGSAGFKISGSGDAEFNDVTVRGALITGSGSQINGDYITAGTITGRTIQTASTNPKACLFASGTYQHYLVFYDASGYDRQRLSYSGIYLRDETGLDVISIQGGTREIKLYNSSGSLVIWLDADTGGIRCSTLTDSPSGRFTFSNAVAFNSTSPVTWTDLDLSSIVGNRRALVFLKVKAQDRNGYFKFRPNGDTHEYSYGADWPQCSQCMIAGGECGTVWVMTDANGVIEWTSDWQQSTVIWVLGYIT